MAKQHDQGVGGVHSVKRNGSNTEQGVGGVLSAGSSIPQKGGKILGNVPSNKGVEGSHLQPHPGIKGETSSMRGGGDIKGHDRTKPGPRAGDKDTQHPNLLNPNLNKKHNYLTG